MTAGRVALLLVAVVFACGLAGPASAAGEPMSVRVDRVSVSTKLGRPFRFRTEIANTGSAPAAGVIAHLNVLSLRDGTYVDPEDWSSNRTRYLAPIRAGASTSVLWRLHAVNTGRFAVYVALVRSDGTALPAVSAPVRVTVADRRTLDSGGIAPLALGIPGLLGAFWAFTRVRRSRRASAQ